MTRRALLVLAVLMALVAVGIASTGGFVTAIAGVRVSARSPLPAATAAAACAAIWLVLARSRRATDGDLQGLEAWLSTRANACTVALAALAGAVATRWQTFSAAGADASGYLSQTQMLVSGHLTRAEPLAAVASWPDAALSVAPLGWWITNDPSVQVPTYAIGLPLLMAPLHALGGALAASLIGPLSLAIAVWAAARLARTIAGPLASILAAVWLATSPVALISAMQPMSDVPATAAWLACWVAVFALVDDDRPASLTTAIAAGLAAAIAIIVRPNLAPVAAVPALLLPVRRRYRAVLVFTAFVALAGAAVAAVQWRWFGSPLRSGYGTAATLYAMANVAPNARLYAAWLLDTQGPWLLVAPFALLPGGRSRARLAWLMAFAALVVAAYLVYAVFENWPYLRFVLPALAVATIAASAVVAQAASHLPRAARLTLCGGVLLAVAGLQVRSARRHEVFDLAERHARAAIAGRYLEAAMPSRAVVLAGEQSGSVRYYTGRSILRWEAMTPDALSAAIPRVTDAGHELWIVLDEWEEDAVRRKFADRIGMLDWPPLLDAGGSLRTRAWRLRDRGAFVRDGSAHSDRVR